jgi:hypothetical protein
VRDATGARTLDFLVIGVQKGGTTSLWRYLRSHPRIRFPRDKEAPFFTSPEADDPAALARLVAADFGDAPEDALLGTVTPQYMMGNAGTSADQIAARIAAALPQVRIVALLRDPIERAISHYRMSVRREWEARSFDDAATDLLDPARAAQARESPTETNAYFAQGEYGRILRGYRDHLPAERVHVAFTAELDADPGRVLDELLAFLGLPPGHRPPDLGRRYHRGGVRRRIDAQAERELRGFLADEIWPALPEGDAGPRAFGFFMETWNTVPDEEQTPVSPDVRERLERHYATDGALLAELGVAAPWLEAWRAMERADATAPAPSAQTGEERELRRALTEANDRLLRRDEELATATAQLATATAQLARTAHALASTQHRLDVAQELLDGERLELEHRAEEILRLRTRLERILRLPPFRVYARLTRLPLLRGVVCRRAARYAADLDSARGEAPAHRAGPQP